MPYRARLARDPAAVHAHPHVDLSVVARGEQRLTHEGLMLVAREVVLQAPPVDLEVPLPGEQDHARDRRLAFAGCLNPRVAWQLDGGL